MIVIGIDQSYKNTGISIAVDGKLIKVGSLDFGDLRLNSEKRFKLVNILTKVINKVKQKLTGDSQIEIICERIRTFSGGFLSTEYIKATGALIATIVDTAYIYNIPVYSVDTRAWKAAVIGTSKPENGDKKMPAIKHICNLGFYDDLLIQIARKRKGSFEISGNNYIWNDDAADSACIALFGFTVNCADKLKLEH